MLFIICIGFHSLYMSTKFHLNRCSQFREKCMCQTDRPTNKGTKLTVMEFCFYSKFQTFCIKQESWSATMNKMTELEFSIILFKFRYRIFIANHKHSSSNQGHRCLCISKSFSRILTRARFIEMNQVACWKRRSPYKSSTDCDGFQENPPRQYDRVRPRVFIILLRYFYSFIKA